MRNATLSPEPRVGAFPLCGSHETSRLSIRPAELGSKPGAKVTMAEPRLDREKFAPDLYFPRESRLGDFGHQTAYRGGRSLRVGNDPRIEVAVIIARTLDDSHTQLHGLLTSDRKTTGGQIGHYVRFWPERAPL